MGYKWAINGCACVIAGRGMNILRAERVGNCNTVSETIGMQQNDCAKCCGSSAAGYRGGQWRGGGLWERRGGG